MAALTIPILFLEGTEDIVVPPEVVRATHEIILGSEYRESRDAGTRYTGKTLRPSTPWWASPWRHIRSGPSQPTPVEWSAFVRPTGQTKTTGREGRKQ